MKTGNRGETWGEAGRAANIPLVRKGRREREAEVETPAEDCPDPRPCVRTAAQSGWNKEGSAPHPDQRADSRRGGRCADFARAAEPRWSGGSVLRGTPGPDCSSETRLFQK